MFCKYFFIKNKILLTLVIMKIIKGLAMIGMAGFAIYSINKLLYRMWVDLPVFERVFNFLLDYIYTAFDVYLVVTLQFSVSLIVFAILTYLYSRRTVL